MADRPILFSAPMVRALLAGTKTQTRRVVKPSLSGREWVEEREDGGFWRCADGEPTCHTGVWETHEYAQQYPIRCPYGQPGDRLWVREAWRAELTWDSIRPSDIPDEAAFWFEADGQQRDNGLGAKFRGKLRPSMFMPRSASRITLEVTGARVERLQDISEADAQAEGIPYSERFRGFCIGEAEHFNSHDPRESYRSLWQAINGPDSWAVNPWVWVVEFRRVTP